MDKCRLKRQSGTHYRTALALSLKDLLTSYTRGLRPYRYCDVRDRIFGPKERSAKAICPAEYRGKWSIFHNLDTCLR
jgi:hypothetical protein